MHKKIIRRAGISTFPWKFLLLIPICSTICLLVPIAAGAEETTNDLVSADLIPPPDVLVPTPDAITPYAGAGVDYDSNVLRLRDSAAAAAMGLGGMSDVIRHAQFGLMLDERISQQHITANLNVNKVNYDRFAALDHLDKNAAVNWNWHAGEHVEGNVGLSYAQGLTPFIDFHDLSPNIRTETSAFVDGAWLIHPSWRLRAGLTHTKLWYDLVSQQPSNNTQTQSELGVDFLARSGSTIGLQARHTSADFPTPEVDSGVQVFNGYNQNELKAKIDWLLTGKTRLHFLGGWVSRKQDQFASRDFSGMNARVSADWSPTGQVDLTVSTWREIGSIYDLSPIYSLNRGASVAALWRYSEKIHLTAQTNYVKRDFSQSSAGGTLGGSSSQNDVLRNTGLTVAYTPTDRWEFRLSGVRSTQTGTVLGGYTSNGMFLNTRYAF